MPPRIVIILDRLRQDLSEKLTADAIKEACRLENYTWRDRVLNPVTTIYLFILQILHGNTACQHIVHFGLWKFTQSAFRAARKRLPLAVLQRLLRRLADTFRSATEDSSLWFGHRVWLIDGSAFSMPDTPELQEMFGQPGGQRRGCGFPVAKFLALFDLATGMLLRVEAAPLRSHEMSRCAAASAGLNPGDIVLGDRGFCSFAHIAILRQRGLHGVFRAHQRQIINFTPGRSRAKRGKAKSVRTHPASLPHSQWLLSQGEADQVVIWYKPKSRPRWMSKEEYAELPNEMTVRELHYKVHSRGFRVSEVTLVTTLLAATLYPAPALADLYYRRWRIEVNFKHLKTTMKMDILKCKTVDGVLKELTVFALVYNLVRSVMVDTAKVQGVSPESVSLVDALRWLVGAEGNVDLSVILVNPARPGRVEPRVVKRRPKQYPRMTKPRSVLRKELLEKEDAA